MLSLPLWATKSGMAAAAKQAGMIQAHFHRRIAAGCQAGLHPRRSTTREIIREILETLLTREGYEVRLASSAAGAGTRAVVPFDAAIVDMMMPGIVISALDELKKIDDDMPVLMITAFLGRERRLRQ